MIITLLVIHVFVTIAMIGLILLQKSDGAGPLGIGGGNNNSLFTARGVANILTRSTAVLATLFIGNCLLIGILTNQEVNKTSKIFSQPVEKQKKIVKKSIKTSEKQENKSVDKTQEKTNK